MSIRSRLALGAIALVVWVGLPLLYAAIPAARALPPVATGPQDPARIGLSEMEIELWRQRLAEANQAIAKLRDEHAEAERAKREMRRDNYPRGEAAAALEKRVEQARAQLAEAEGRLPALVEQARRAGVPPGVLRPYWD